MGGDDISFAESERLFANNDLLLRTQLWGNWVEDDLPEVKKGSIGSNKLKKVILALDATYPRWENRADRHCLLRDKLREMCPDAFKKESPTNKKAVKVVNSPTVLSVSANFVQNPTERDIIRQLEQDFRQKLTFPGAYKLKVKVIRDASGEFEIRVRGSDELVELAGRYLGLSTGSNESVMKVPYLP